MGVKKYVLLGTTIETNRDELITAEISKAHLPSKRYKDFLTVNHPRKMITIEPVMKFDLEVLIKWIIDLNPEMVWLGYDSKKSNLPEPSLTDVQNLGEKISENDIALHFKTIREARK